MKHCLLFLSFLQICLYSSAQEYKSVLFIGNSLTYYNDMPQILQKMIDDQGLHIIIEQITFPGHSLSAHLMRVKDKNGAWRRSFSNEISPSVQKILSKEWDMVILQEGSSLLLVPATQKYNYEIAVMKLDSIIKLKKSRTILYQPFTSNAYPQQVCYPGGSITAGMPVIDTDFNTKLNYCSDSFFNSLQEFNTLAKECKKAAQMINANVAEVGYAFEVCKKVHPEIELYMSAVNDHPSLAGSYVIVCVFYNYITGKKLAGVKNTGGLDEITANKIQSLVDSIKFE